jgi:hypothetical protein
MPAMAKLFASIESDSELPENSRNYPFSARASRKLFILQPFFELDTDGF